MKRRSYLKTMLAVGAAGTAAIAQGATHPIVLDVDLSVDPSKEHEMLDHFRNTFKPAAVKFPGYVDDENMQAAVGASGIGTRRRQLPFSAYIPERGTAAKVGGIGYP